MGNLEQVIISVALFSHLPSGNNTTSLNRVVVKIIIHTEPLAYCYNIVHTPYMLVTIFIIHEFELASRVHDFSLFVFSEKSSRTKVKHIYPMRLLNTYKVNLVSRKG